MTSSYPSQDRHFTEVKASCGQISLRIVRGSVGMQALLSIEEATSIRDEISATLKQMEEYAAEFAAERLARELKAGAA